MSSLVWSVLFGLLAIALGVTVIVFTPPFKIAVATCVVALICAGGALAIRWADKSQ